MSKLLIVTLLLLSAGYYSYFIMRVRRGLFALQSDGSFPEHPFVSVIVAARDEEEHIQKCIDSLHNQDYPSDRYELIVVDDGSSDRTPEIATNAFRQHRNSRLLRIAPAEHPTHSGKPDCIAHGVRKARGEIILLTDADCVVPSTWISSIISCFEPYVALVAGPVLENAQSGIFSRIQSLEYLGLTTTAAGLIGADRPIICSGANLAYRTSAFREVNGFGENGTSCDDETLMLRIYQRGIGSIAFAADKRAVVVTTSDYSFGSFWSRRTRWASKRGHYEDKSILFSLLSLYLFFLMLLALAIASLMVSDVLVFVGLIFVWKIYVDYRTLSAGAKIFGASVPMADFFIAELLHVPYIAVAAAAGQIRSFRWKGRTHNR